ncbi:nitroreductase/quinone reductase family protein [Georgenia alba]|uniref:Nitroreductase/quinone reductase family protein n=1 Tax=Georgenia alba TaxID=2233858 RepID=A0ABW2QHT8_9MICO
MADVARTEDKPPWVPPLWFKRAAWAFQRRMYRLTGGRYPLSRPSAERRTSGLLRLRTVGRRTGQERAVILAYWEDGRNFVTLAMNGWEDPPPAWWLNLLAHPDVEVDTVDGPRRVHGREAVGPERERLWAELAAYRGWGKGLDRYAALRSRPTPVVVLEPR